MAEPLARRGGQSTANVPRSLEKCHTIQYFGLKIHEGEDAARVIDSARGSIFMDFLINVAASPQEPRW